MEKEIRKHEALRTSATTNEEAITRLVNLIEVLRAECPWDKEQTHKSLRVCMIEEAYEVAEAIDNEDMLNLREELGDVLLQVVFHSSLAIENDHFTLCDVINEECEKMIRRHPHIFCDEVIKSVDKVLEKWENVKRKEKGEVSNLSRLTQVPLALPALTRSFKVQARAAEVGFDWDDVAPAFQKIQEETEELIGANEANDADMVIEELGDLLFSVVNVARFLKVDPEYALTQSTNKFIKRFAHMEDFANSSGKKLEGMSLSELDRLWEEAKSLEKAEKADK